MVEVTHYTYRVSWSPEDQEFVGTCVEFPSLSWLAASQDDAFHGIERVVEGVVADLSESGEEIPKPLAERQYSGRFNVRIPPDTHRRLVTEAAEQGVSLNRFVSDRLASCV
jgi:predicted HicB family RNase H-like nuclease